LPAETQTQEQADREVRDAAPHDRLEDAHVGRKRRADVEAQDDHEPPPSAGSLGPHGRPDASVDLDGLPALVGAGARFGILDAPDPEVDDRADAEQLLAARVAEVPA